MSLFKEDLLDRAEAGGKAPADARRLLVVDDEAGNLRVLRTLFGDRLHVLEARYGAEALHVLRGLQREQWPAVILSDQRMPRMTGVELFERVREEMPDAIRIIITGFVDVGAIVDSINRAGIYKFVVKPYDHEDLRLTSRVPSRPTTCAARSSGTSRNWRRAGGRMPEGAECALSQRLAGLVESGLVRVSRTA